MRDKKLLTQDQNTWFSERLTESATGAVKVPSHLINKFKKITDQHTMENWEIRDYLITNCFIDNQ